MNDQMMTVVNKIKEIYQTEGIRAVLDRVVKRTTQTLFPVPTVRNQSTPTPLWILSHIYNLYFTLQYGGGCDVMTQDWDTLILLDACRFDDFKDINDLPGTLDSKISKGVDSKQFIKRNFVGESFQDTVYVTANPHVGLLNKDVFHDVITEPISNWNSEIDCVMPTEVTTAAIRAHKEYPNKRIIVHYMQPHDPPLGPTADSLRREYNIGGAAPGDQESDGDRIMELVAEEVIPKDSARKAYQETLEIVLDDVEGLLDSITGKVVISSDHGEMFGESPYPILGELFEHYRNPKTIELCRVPWFVPNQRTKRRRVIPETHEDTMSVDNQDIEKQLEALGYK
jgi:hypothetical protein